MYKSPFEQDPRNLGGRVITATRMYEHQKALNNTKPTINTKKEPKKHVDADKIKKPLLYQQEQQFGNIRKTFSAIGQQKKRINNDKPQTMTYKHMNQNVQKPKVRKNKQESFLESEHRKRIENQQKRIKQQNTLQERKKNPYDPEVNPVVLFRRGDDPKGVNHYMKGQAHRTATLGVTMKRPKSAYNDSFQREGGSRLYEKTKKEDDEDEMRKLREWYRERDFKEKKLEPHRDKNQKKRPLTQAEKDKIDSEQIEAEKDYIYEIPKVQGDDDDDYQFIKIRIIEIIVKYRVFKTDDLKYLEAKTFIHNRHLDKDLYNEIWQEIYEDLDQ